MIERHYFQGQLVKSYDFTFGYCIPGSTNEWEAVYAVPGIEDYLSKFTIFFAELDLRVILDSFFLFTIY